LHQMRQADFHDAAECPFCLAVQPDIIDIKKLDTDGDGIWIKLN